eukprot:26676-Eustigmatos_ZCMA.PRE.1
MGNRAMYRATVLTVALTIKIAEPVCSHLHEHTMTQKPTQLVEAIIWVSMLLPSLGPAPMTSSIRNKRHVASA